LAPGLVFDELQRGTHGVRGGVGRAAEQRVGHAHLHIRNFSIIAHIDHGKSTLSDRILESAARWRARHARPSTSTPWISSASAASRSRLQSVRLDYKDQTYTLNLIDTPGHVDFGYEVSRSLAACEGVILLVVDAPRASRPRPWPTATWRSRTTSRSWPASTRSTCRPPTPTATRRDRDMLGIPADGDPAHQRQDRRGRRPSCSTPSSSGSRPEGRPRRAAAGAHLRLPVRPVPRRRVVGAGHERPRCAPARSSGSCRPATYEADEVGVRPEPTPVNELGPGEVGYLIAGIKDVAEARSGETVTTARNPAPSRSTATATPSRWCSAASTRSTATSSRPARRARQAEAQRRQLHLRARDVGRARLRLPLRLPRPAAHGDRAGAPRARVRPRPHRHAPSVEYQVHQDRRQVVEVDNPPRCPDDRDRHIEEPGSTWSILTPQDYTGTIMDLCQTRRGEMDKIEYLSPERVELHYEMPLAEVVFDFFDQLKSRTQGYASLDYEPPATALATS
jgi:GTP-binding protein LepA